MTIISNTLCIIVARGRRVAPVSTRESTNLTDDVFDRLTPGPPSPTPSVHRRSESDPFKTNPNLMDIAASCEPYLQGGKRGNFLYIFMYVYIIRYVG